MSSRMHAIWEQKCPICFRGLLWSGRITMNQTCSVCGLVFEREQGYWTGAMYVAYALASPILAALTLLAWMTTGAGVGRSFLLAVIVFCPLSPAIVRYSRAIWLHIDQLVDPREPGDLTLNRS